MLLYKCCIAIIYIHKYRRSHAPTSGVDLKQITDDGMSVSDSQTVILEPLKLSVQVIRNISAPSTAHPNVDVQLNLDHVKVIIVSMTISLYRAVDDWHTFTKWMLCKHGSSLSASR